MDTPPALLPRSVVILDGQQFAALFTDLSRIASALEQIAITSAPPAPNYTRPIEDYTSFDWGAIGAEVKEKDENGPTFVEHGGYTYTRRSPQNKFGTAIWFSRPNGKDADGNVKYLRLITFKPSGEAESLPKKALDALPKKQAATAKDPMPGIRDHFNNGVRHLSNYTASKDIPPALLTAWSRAVTDLNAALAEFRLKPIQTDLFTYETPTQAKSTFNSQAKVLADTLKGASDKVP